MCIFAQTVPRPLEGEEPGRMVVPTNPQLFHDTRPVFGMVSGYIPKEQTSRQTFRLITDAHSTHVSANVIAKAIINEVEVITIPSKSSHVLQLFD